MTCAFLFHFRSSDLSFSTIGLQSMDAIHGSCGQNMCTNCRDSWMKGFSAGADVLRSIIPETSPLTDQRHNPWCSIPHETSNTLAVTSRRVSSQVVSANTQETSVSCFVTPSGGLGNRKGGGLLLSHCHVTISVATMPKGVQSGGPRVPGCRYQRIEVI